MYLKDGDITSIHLIKNKPMPSRYGHFQDEQWHEYQQTTMIFHQVAVCLTTDNINTSFSSKEEIMSESMRS